jgi:transposase
MSFVMPRARKYPVELLDPGARLVFESGRPIAQVAADLGVKPESLRRHVCRIEVNEGRREGLSSEEREEIKRLKRENFELRRANEILKAASVFFAKELDPDRWTQHAWLNRFNGRTYQITTEPSNGRIRPGLVTVKTHRDTILDYATHPEPKSLAADGSVCDRKTAGLLTRRPVTPTIILHVGKESNRLEEAQLGLLDDSDQPLNRYGDAQLAVFRELVVPVLKDLGVRETARRTGHGLGSVSAALAGRSTPRFGALCRYTQLALDHAGRLVSAEQTHPSADPQARLAEAVELIRARGGDSVGER